MSTYHSSAGMCVHMCLLTNFPFMQQGFSRRRYSPLKYLDPAAAGLEAGECPDVSSFCQFLRWMIAPAPKANSLPFLFRVVKQKGIVSAGLAFECIRSRKKKNCILKNMVYKAFLCPCIEKRYSRVLETHRTAEWGWDRLRNVVAQGLP